MQQIQGRIIKFLPIQEGDSRNGNHWKKAGFVIEVGDEYPKKIAFSLFGEDRLNQCKGLQQGMFVQVDYNPESREYNDRWYTELNCIRISAIGQQQPAPAPAAQPAAQYPQMPATSAPAAMPNAGDDNLPF